MNVLVITRPDIEYASTSEHVYMLNTSLSVDEFSIYFKARLASYLKQRTALWTELALHLEFEEGSAEEAAFMAAQSAYEDFCQTHSILYQEGFKVDLSCFVLNEGELVSFKIQSLDEFVKSKLEQSKGFAPISDNENSLLN